MIGLWILSAGFALWAAWALTRTLRDGDAGAGARKYDEPSPEDDMVRVNGQTEVPTSDEFAELVDRVAQLEAKIEKLLALAGGPVPEKPAQRFPAPGK